MLKVLISALAVLLSLAPSYGGETPWVEIAPNARIRLVSADVKTGDKTLAAIEIDMPQSTKTYWRIPGETGIPLVMKSDKSRSIKNPRVLWPYPVRESSGGFVDFVYHGHTVLPVELDVVGDLPRFEADLFMGICDDICVPVQVDLALDINLDKPDAAQQLRIAQAMADVPQIWEKQPDPFGPISFDPATQRLSVPYVPGMLDPASLIADTGKASDLFGLPQKSPKSDVVYLQMLGQRDDLGLSAAPITLTFMTDDGAFELSRALAPAANAQ